MNNFASGGCQAGFFQARLRADGDFLHTHFRSLECAPVSTRHWGVKAISLHTFVNVLLGWLVCVNSPP